MNADENEAIVDASGLTVDDLGAEWPAFRHPKRPEFLLTLPHVHGTAGFFIARLKNLGSAAWTRACERALELAERGRERPTRTPSSAQSSSTRAKSSGKAGTSARVGRTREVTALDAAGERARGSTLYVTMEPCAHHGRTPPCVDAVLEAGVSSVVAGCARPGRDSGGGLERLRAAGLEVELVDAFEARAQNEAWRTWTTERRPFVIYKVAATLDGRVSVPGVALGERARRAAGSCTSCARSVDAVAVGMGTVRADDPRLDARGVDAARQPRRLAFGSGPLPEGSELELRSGPLADELAALAEEGVQSLLLEGGPTLATAFLEQGLVDKLLVFVAPRLSGSGPAILGELSQPVRLSRMDVQRVGDDVLLSAYVREP